MNTFKPIRLSVLAFSLSIGTASFSALAADSDTINGWQSSLAAEFVKLDTSGNGLLLPNEASKSKSFSKKTFAKADSDNDGTIDQNEYISYKTSLGEKDIPAETMAVNSASNESGMTSEMQNTAAASATSDQQEQNMDVAEMSKSKLSKDSVEPKKQSVGVVIDDSIITTKAKAAIFNTPELKTLDISVETRQGKVVLTGTVVSEAAKMKAEEVVKSVGGVNSVTNNLMVKG